MTKKSFSSELDRWVKGKQPKTLDTLIDTFGEKSFAVIMMLFMLLPALPGPTAAHPFEAVVIIVAAEQVIGFKALLVPEFISSRIKLEAVARSKTMQKVLGLVKWIESKSSRRGAWVFRLPYMNRVLGLVIIGYTLAAFFSPPFSLLDTLPAIGVVLISLSLLFEDAILLLAGLIIGAAGTFLVVFFGKVIAAYLKHHLFHKQ